MGLYAHVPKYLFASPQAAATRLSKATSGTATVNNVGLKWQLAAHLPSWMTPAREGSVCALAEARERQLKAP